MKIIKHCGVLFCVSNGTITNIRNKGRRKDIYIPNVFPTGETVSAVGKDAFEGQFGKVTLSPGISNISDDAFASADVFEVVWSSGCSTIPIRCFCMSNIQKISGIENVDNICRGAFAHSGIRNLAWPCACKRIPDHCFFYSRLENIYSINGVSEIGEQAFAGVQNISKIDLSALGNVSIGLAAFEGVPLEKIELPYYFETTERIF